MQNQKWMNYKKATTGFVFVLLLFQYVNSTGEDRKGALPSDNPDEGKAYIYVSDKTEPEDYSAYLTWKDYDGYGGEEKAVFVWNSKEMGKGSQGLKSVIGEMMKLPKCSKILVFPSYAVDLYGMKRSGYPRKYPFSDNMGVLGNKDFKKTVEENGLVLLISTHDNNGKILEESKKPGGGKL